MLYSLYTKSNWIFLFRLFSSLPCKLVQDCNYHQKQILSFFNCKKKVVDLKEPVLVIKQNMWTGRSGPGQFWFDGGLFFVLYFCMLQNCVEDATPKHFQHSIYVMINNTTILPNTFRFVFFLNIGSRGKNSYLSQCFKSYFGIYLNFFFNSQQKNK